jgi:hypothetical protein
MNYTKVKHTQPQGVGMKKPLLIVLQGRALRLVVMTVVAQVAGKKLKNIRPTTHLPAERCRLMARLDEETDGLPRHAYTGEARTVGDLIEILANCQARLK